MQRRAFLIGLLTTPAIVRASSLDYIPRQAFPDCARYAYTYKGQTYFWDANRQLFLTKNNEQLIGHVDLTRIGDRLVSL